MKTKIFAVLLTLTSLATAQEVQQRRIVRPVDNADVIRLSGSVSPRIHSATDQGAALPTLRMQHMTLFFQPTAQQQAALDQLLAEQQDPTSQQYHKWITPEQFADQFGINSGDIAVLSAWLQSQGFTVDITAHSRTWIAFSGTAAQVEAAFHTSIHNYLANGVAHYAAASEPTIPAAFSNVVTGIGGLHNFGPKARSFKANPRLTSSLTGNHFLAPGDFATIYNLPAYTNGVPCTPGTCNDGTGQTIAIMAQTNLSTDSNSGRNGTPGVNGQQYDVVTFRNLAGLPALTSSSFQIVIVPPYGDPGVITSDVDEANLDVEWAGAAAPGANLIFVIENPNNGGNGAFGAFEYTVDNFSTIPANIISISYGVCEPQLNSTNQSEMTAAAQQANAQGQTLVGPSGDDGAADCDANVPATQGLAVDFPGSLPNFTSMGGTTFSADSANSTAPASATPYWAGSTNDTSPSALAYIPETAWNDTSITTPSLSASGGGVSKLFTKPSWQTGTGVPNDGQRDVPDIAFTASAEHDGYLICSQSSCVNGYRDSSSNFDVLGGTSAPTPTFAGIVALINQKLSTAQGNVNPSLYAQAASAPWAFNDVTTGNNIVTCTVSGTDTGCNGGSMGYSAGVGYDLVTGLGSVNVAPLINALTGVSDFSVTPSASSLTVPANGSSTLTLSVLGTSGSSINFSNCTALSPLVSVTCSAPTVTAAGSTAVTSTLTVSNTTSNSETGTVNVVASNGSITHLVPIALTVSGGTASFTLTVASPVVSIPSGGTITDNLTVAAVNGFSSSVALTCAVPTSLGSTSCTINPTSVAGGSGTAIITINGAVLSGKMTTPLPFNHRGFGSLSVFAMALGLVFASGEKRRRLTKRAWRNMLLGLLLLVVALGAVSCGGGGNSGGGGGGTTPLNGTITVTGTGGGVTQTVTINVTVT